MVKVLLEQKDPENLNEIITKELYFDGYIKSNLDIGIKQLFKDFDMVWFVDGAEGAGKSDLVAQMAYYVNRPDTRHTLIDRICTTPETFDEAILNAKKYEAVVLDEAFGAMSSSGSLSKVNRVLQRRFTEIRSKNLFVFIAAPSFMDIMRYFAIWRSKCLIHVYLGKGQERGRAAFYGDKKKRKLYILGKKNFYNYSCVPPNFVFRFIKQMHKVIDVKKYKEKKDNIQSNNIEQEITAAQKEKEEDFYKKIVFKLWEKNHKISIKEVYETTAIPRGRITDILKEIKLNSLEKAPKSA